MHEDLVAIVGSSKKVWDLGTIPGDQVGLCIKIPI
jgi:hypothetical protein